MREKTSFIVTDMSCNHCVGTIRAALEHALPDTQVEIDLASRTVEFTGDRAKGEAAIRDAGYSPEKA